MLPCTHHSTIGRNSGILARGAWNDVLPRTYEVGAGAARRPRGILYLVLPATTLLGAAGGILPPAAMARLVAQDVGNSWGKRIVWGIMRNHGGLEFEAAERHQLWYLSAAATSAQIYHVLGHGVNANSEAYFCLLYTSDAADE